MSFCYGGVSLVKHVAPTKQWEAEENEEDLQKPLLFITICHFFSPAIRMSITKRESGVIIDMK